MIKRYRCDTWRGYEAEGVMVEDPNGAYLNIHDLKNLLLQIVTVHNVGKDKWCRCEWCRLALQVGGEEK